MEASNSCDPIPTTRLQPRDHLRYPKVRGTDRVRGSPNAARQGGCNTRAMTVKRLPLDPPCGLASAARQDSARECWLRGQLFSDAYADAQATHSPAFGLRSVC